MRQVGIALIGLGLVLGAGTNVRSAPGPLASERSAASRIEFAVTPPDVVIFLDGERLGPAAKVGRVDAKPGRRIIRLERGEDATEMEVQLTKGKMLRFTYEFE
jgi:hypothetical protein